MIKNKISWVVSVLSILNTAGPARLQNKIWLQSQKGWKVGLTKKKKEKKPKPGDRVLVSVPISSTSLLAHYSSIFVVEKKKICDIYDFIAMFYCKWRSRLCHIKMLKPYFDQWFVWFKLSRQSKNCFDVFFSPPTCMWCAGISTGMPVAADNKIGDADGPSMAMVQGNWNNS